MKKLKQIFAATGAVLLLGMYVITLIFALSDKPQAGNMLMASLFATVIIPVFLYACILVYRWTRKPEEIPSIHKDAAIDTVIFDLGKVLVEYDWKGFLEKLGYNKEAIQAVGDAMFTSEDWTEADRGIRTEKEILDSFIDNDPEYEEEIRNAFEQMGSTIHTFNYTRNWLKYLKKRGYKIYFLSNFSKPLYERCKKELNFLELMDGGYMSWQVNMLKPEPAFYQKLLRDFHIDPQRAVFIDDVLENVAEARAQKIHAVHFRNKKETIRELMDIYDVS